MASGFTVATNTHLLRSNVWTKQIKQLLLDDLNAMKFVRIISDFPDGVTFNIPSIGEAETADFSEGQAIKYNKMDTGNFTFTFDQYKYSANAISEKFKRDSFYSSDVISAFVPRQHRALMEAVEVRILGRGPGSQTASSTNQINGADHRWVGSGINNTIGLQDFVKAQYALIKANVPLTDLVAVVDPTVAYTLQTQTNLVNLLSPNPKWQSIVNTGAVTGMRFMYNVYGFDVYVSNYLNVPANETISGRTTTAPVANLFFSAAPGDTLPIVGGFRQMPTVFSEFNKDLQQEEYVTFAEYGFKTYRLENMVVVLTDTNQVI
jgi:hypothetical protein